MPADTPTPTPARTLADTPARDELLATVAEHVKAGRGLTDAGARILLSLAESYRASALSPSPGTPGGEANARGTAGLREALERRIAEIDARIAADPDWVPETLAVGVETARAIAAALAARPAEADPWVRVTEDPASLPPKGERVCVVFRGDGWPSFGMWNEREWDSGDWTQPARRNEVTHWRRIAPPLPAAPDAAEPAGDECSVCGKPAVPHAVAPVPLCAEHRDATAENAALADADLAAFDADAEPDKPAEPLTVELIATDAAAAGIDLDAAARALPAALPTDGPAVTADDLAAMAADDVAATYLHAEPAEPPPAAGGDALPAWWHPLNNRRHHLIDLEFREELSDVGRDELAALDAMQSDWLDKRWPLSPVPTPDQSGLTDRAANFVAAANRIADHWDTGGDGWWAGLIELMTLIGRPPTGTICDPLAPRPTDGKDGQQG